MKQLTALDSHLLERDGDPMKSDVSRALCLPVFSGELSCVSGQVFSVCSQVFVWFYAADVCLLHSLSLDFFEEWGGRG